MVSPPCRGRKDNSLEQHRLKRVIGWEPFLFLLGFFAIAALFVSRMGFVNTLSTIMQTAYKLLLDTVLFLTAIAVSRGLSRAYCRSLAWWR